MSQVQQLHIQSLDGKTTASFVPQRGGTMSSLKVSAKEGVRELLYWPDGFDLSNVKRTGGGMPLCFPVCGRLSRADGDGRYLYEGKTYQLENHGFGFRLPWQVLSHGSDHINFGLRANDITLAQYPFDFEIILSYRVKSNELICEQSFINHDSKPMPYYAGFHPYIRIPFAKEQVTIDYKPLQRLQYSAALTDIIGTQACVKTPVALTDTALNENLSQLGTDKTVNLYFPDGSLLSIEAEGIEDPDLYAYMQLYHIATEPFFCVEPWMSFPNAMNSVQGVRWIQPGKSEHGKLRLAFGFE